MVHALHEAWRVLIPHGIMIEMRPLCINIPLDIIFKGENESAGFVDNSPDIKDEIAADHAIESAVNDRIFKELMVERFKLAYYWKTVRGMVADIRKRWKDDVILVEKVIQRAYQIFRKHRPHAQVRLFIQMRSATYEKQE